MPKVFLKYKKMTASAIAPHKVHPDDTGFGLYADQTVYFAPFDFKRAVASDCERPLYCVIASISFQTKRPIVAKRSVSCLLLL